MTGAGIAWLLSQAVVCVAVVATGWLLGGTVGVGTVVYALGVGPLVQLFLPRTTQSGREPRFPAAPNVLEGQRACT